VLGLICAALGRDRKEPVADLAALRMGVRVDREGVPMRDYQTATGVLLATGKVDAHRTVVSPRFYLADAAFWLDWKGRIAPNLKAFRRRSAHLCGHSPRRKSFVPGLPVLLPDGLQDQALIVALETYPRLAPPQRGQRKDGLRIMVEHDSEGSIAAWTSRQRPSPSAASARDSSNREL